MTSRLLTGRSWAPIHSFLLEARPLRPQLPPPVPTRLRPTSREVHVAATLPSQTTDEDGDEVFDFEGTDKESLKLDLTDSTVKQLLKARERHAQKSGSSKEDPYGLRLAVASGGCHGYQYQMTMTSSISPTDFQFLAPSGALVVVDPSSMALLKGATIDYATELIGSSFRVLSNPQAQDGAGCGCGVSWSLKGDP